MSADIDWESKPEPWRTCGLRFREECQRIVADRSPSPSPSSLHTIRYGVPLDRPTDTRTLGGRLRAIRLERGITLRVASRAMAVHVTTVSNWETNTMTPRPKRLAEISRYYDVPLSQLLTG